MEAKWVLHSEKADFKAIGEKYNIDQVIARVITNRGVFGDDNIEKYLNPEYEDTHDPSLMRDMDKGCRIMRDKINNNEKIRIVSDYDVDGVTSNYILYTGLKMAGAIVTYDIPDRVKDGYGMNIRIVDKAKEDGIDTIITCDNGIAAFDAIDKAKEYGMTVIVTDHHEVPYELVRGVKMAKYVDADAIIDPKREDCEYPFKGLCGAGVAYKFIRRLYEIMEIEWPDEDWLVDILAIGTVCDIMDLVDENRVYVKKGLSLLNNPSNLGIKKLIEATGIKGKKIQSYHLGFIIGPCINAAGRLLSAYPGLELLLETDEERAMELANSLADINAKRKVMTVEGEKEGVEIAKENYSDDKVLVVYMPKLHESLAGLVAGRIKECFYRPTFVLTKTEEGRVKGSGRSIEGYNMFEELNRVKHLDIQFGGHALAAGLSMSEETVDEFRRTINELECMSEETLTPKVKFDANMPFSYVNLKLVKDLDRLEPFGKANPKPLFGQADMNVKQISFFGKEKQYANVTFQDKNGYKVTAVTFDAKKLVEMIKGWFGKEECDRMLIGCANEVYLDVAYYPQIDDYGGRNRIKYTITDFRKA